MESWQGRKRKLTWESRIIKDSFAEMRDVWVCKIEVPKSVDENRSKTSKEMDNFQTECSHPPAPEKERSHLETKNSSGSTGGQEMVKHCLLSKNASNLEFSSRFHSHLKESHQIFKISKPLYFCGAHSQQLLENAVHNQDPGIGDPSSEQS